MILSRRFLKVLFCLVNEFIALFVSKEFVCPSTRLSTLQNQLCLQAVLVLRILLLRGVEAELWEICFLGDRNVANFVCWEAKVLNLV